MGKIPINIPTGNSQTASATYSVPQSNIHANDDINSLEAQTSATAMKSFQKGIAQGGQFAGNVLNTQHAIAQKAQHAREQIYKADLQSQLSQAQAQAKEDLKDVRDPDVYQKELTKRYTDLYNGWKQDKIITNQFEQEIYPFVKDFTTDTVIAGRSQARKNDYNYHIAMADTTIKDMKRNATPEHLDQAVVIYNQLLDGTEAFIGKKPPEVRDANQKAFISEYVANIHAKTIDDTPFNAIHPDLWMKDDRLLKEQKISLNTEYKRKEIEYNKQIKAYTKELMNKGYDFMLEDNVIPTSVIDNLSEYSKPKAMMLHNYNKSLKKSTSPTSSTAKAKAEQTAMKHKDTILNNKVSMVLNSQLDKDKKEKLINELLPQIQTSDGVVKVMKLLDTTEKFNSNTTPPEKQIYNDVMKMLNKDFALRDYDTKSTPESDIEKIRAGEFEKQKYGVYKPEQKVSHWYNFTGLFSPDIRNEVDIEKDRFAVAEISKGLQEWILDKKSRNETFTGDELKKQAQTLAEPYSIDKYKREIDKHINQSINYDKKAFDWMFSTPLGQGFSPVKKVNGVDYRLIGNEWKKITQ